MCKLPTSLLVCVCMLVCNCIYLYSSRTLCVHHISDRCLEIAISVHYLCVCTQVTLLHATHSLCGGADQFVVCCGAHENHAEKAKACNTRTYMVNYAQQVG